MLDELVTRVVNKLKETTEIYRTALLEGGCGDFAEYKERAGWLTGIDDAIATLIEEAKKIEKEI